MWTILLVSQSPHLRRGLLRELDWSASESSLASPRLLRWTLKESLRLLPPNALMIRVTAREVLLGGFRLPSACEVLLSPYLSHRNPRLFPDPRTFRPERWAKLRPSAFDYLPFGAGTKQCLGSALAIQMLQVALTGLLRRYDLMPVADRPIDWKISVTLMPADVVCVSVSPRRAGRVSPSPRSAVA